MVVLARGLSSYLCRAMCRVRQSVSTGGYQYKNTKLTDFVECWRHMRWNGNIYAFNADSLSNDSGIPFGPISGTRVTLPWYPAPNLDRALAPSLVGRFSCLTKELVARLNFGSASAQAAQPLLRLVIRCSPSYSGSSPNLSPILGPSLLLATHALPTSAVPHEFCQL
jgi:hypothetical protein